MRYSQLFGKTVKEVAQDVKLVSHRLLYQGGFIRESVAGRYYFLPLGMRVQDKIVRVIEQEMNRAGAQKLITPVMHPLELWEESNRTSSVGFELMTIKDQRGAKFALGGTAEEMMVDLVRKFTLSYKDIPFNIYQFSQKFRDEKRARGGLLRVREFLMKDAYSFHADEADFKKEYKKMWDTYTRIFQRVGLKTIPIEADNGYIGGDYCHEFVVESDAGESKFLITKDGAYAAHEEAARWKRDEKNMREKLLPMEVKSAPRGPTIEDGNKLYGIQSWRQIKSVVYITDTGEKVMACLRGDLDVNEIQLCHALKCVSLRSATPEEVNELGTIVGFVSPLKAKIRKVGDSSLKTVHNFYTGADSFQMDTLNVNYERDFTVDIMAEIALPPEKCNTPEGKALFVGHGIEVGNIFQLGTHYTTRMKGANYVNEKGGEVPYYMGCYGIGVGRTMGAVVEIHNDKDGIIWPKSIAPYLVHLVTLGTEASTHQAADKLYQEMLQAGIEVLYDDRDERAGVKFKDADLIGIPLRIVLSDRTFNQKSVEWKERWEEKAKGVSLDILISEIKQWILNA